MYLSTLFFVFAFLPVSLILYLVCPRVCKNALLVLISFVFYAWGSPVYLLLLLLVTVFNYCVGLDIGNRAESGQRGTKFLLVIGVLFNLLLLGFYKYAAFAIETLNAILPFTLNAPSAALPLGISFFTFQNLSYLSDVYHRRAPAQMNDIRGKGFRRAETAWLFPHGGKQLLIAEQAVFAEQRLDGLKQHGGSFRCIKNFN